MADTAVPTPATLVISVSPVRTVSMAFPLFKAEGPVRTPWLWLPLVLLTFLLPSAAAGSGRERAGREHRPRSRARLGVLPVIIAALAAWLLLSGLHLGVFAWPGRLALFLVIFAAIRWLMRFLWNLGRGGGPMGGGR